MTSDQDHEMDQLFFEYYFHRHIRVIKDRGWNIEAKELLPYRIILEGLSFLAMPMPTRSANTIRAKLLMISNCVVKLKAFINEEESSDDLIEYSIDDFLRDIHTLQGALQNIIKYVDSAKFRIIQEKCLFQLNCLWEQATSKLDGDLNPPSFIKLWSLMRKLICKASQLIDDPTETNYQLLEMMSGGKLRERRCRLSHLQEIIGKEPEESDDEDEIRALQEKCRRRKMKRQRSSESSDEQSTPKSDRQMKYGSLTSRPKKLSVSAKEQVVRKKTELEENFSDDQEYSEDSPVKRKYPTLPDVHPRHSLINFTRKPPSHSRGKGGKWLPNEEEEFILKTIQIGEGRWAEIRTAMGSARSSVQLKDKWRQISLSRVEKVARQNGLKYVGIKKSTNKST